MAQIKSIDVAKWIGLALTIITLIVGTVVWASNSHTDLENRADMHDRILEKDMKETMRYQYTPLHEFTKMEQKIDNQTSNIKDNSNKIDKIDKDIDSLSNKLDLVLERLHSNR